MEIVIVENFITSILFRLTAITWDRSTISSNCKLFNLPSDDVNGDAIFWSSYVIISQTMTDMQKVAMYGY